MLSWLLWPQNLFSPLYLLTSYGRLLGNSSWEMLGQKKRVMNWKSAAVGSFPGSATTCHSRLIFPFVKWGSSNRWPLRSFPSLKFCGTVSMPVLSMQPCWENIEYLRLERAFHPPAKPVFALPAFMELCKIHSIVKKYANVFCTVCCHQEENQQSLSCLTILPLTQCPATGWSVWTRPVTWGSEPWGVFRICSYSCSPGLRLAGPVPAFGLSGWQLSHGAMWPSAERVSNHRQEVDHLWLWAWAAFAAGVPVPLLWCSMRWCQSSFSSFTNNRWDYSYCDLPPEQPAWENFLFLGCLFYVLSSVWPFFSEASELVRYEKEKYRVDQMAFRLSVISLFYTLKKISK